MYFVENSFQTSWETAGCAQNKRWWTLWSILWSACSYRPEPFCTGMFSATPCMLIHTCAFWVLLYWIWRVVLYNTTRQMVWQNAAASCQCVPMHKCGRAGSKQHWILCNCYTDWRTLSNFINNDVTVPSVNVAHSCAYQTYFCKHKVTNVQNFLANTHLH